MIQPRNLHKITQHQHQTFMQTFNTIAPAYPEVDMQVSLSFVSELSVRFHQLPKCLIAAGGGKGQAERARVYPTSEMVAGKLDQGEDYEVERFISHVAYLWKKISGMNGCCLCA